MAGQDDLKKAANAVGEQHGADVLLLSGDLERGVDDKVIALVGQRKRRKVVVFVLVTPGGDADASYRIARCLQDSYDKFIIIVPGWCKSAGTLCVLGAQELVMADCAELGPLDVQFFKKDELGDVSSGLVLKEALASMREHAFSMFEEYMLTIKRHSNNLITFRTATDIAVKLTVGMFEPLCRQIEPMQVGELERSMAIAQAYGQRLQIKSTNFGPRTLTDLVETYPSHGFVIDRREAQQLFQRVRGPEGAEGALIVDLGEQGRIPKSGLGDPVFLNDEFMEVQNGQANGQAAAAQAALQGAGSSGAASSIGGAEASESAAASSADSQHVKLVK